MPIQQTHVQVQTHQQTQQQVQTQTLSPQQVMYVRLLELPVEALKDRVIREMEENPYLEVAPSPEDDYTGDPSATRDGDSAGGSENDGPTYDVRDDYSSEDDVPDYMLRQPRDSEGPAMEYGDTQSFYDHLMEQVGEFQLTDHQRQLLEYLVGSLDDDGLLRKSLQTLVYELETWHGIECTIQELEQVLHILWRFEPAGVGGRTLQECLIIQVRRGVREPQRSLMLQVLDKMWDEFERKRWDRIQQRMHLDDVQVEQLRREIRHLNPRPGTALGERMGEGSQHITPDFVVETDQYGVITMQLNNGDVPVVCLSEDLGQDLRTVDGQRPTEMTEDLRFRQRYAERGRQFIEAIGQRRLTMQHVMKAIIRLQKPFFQEGDEALLRPMRLDDVAQIAAVDISTVSRVTNNKYVQTSYGTYPLKWFFTAGSTQDGEDVSVRKVQAALREIIQNEDKARPMTDEALTQAMRQAGYSVARRTISKYREEMGFPVARMRKN